MATKPNRTIYTDEYCDGYQAFHDGQPVEANPYEPAGGIHSVFYHKAYNWRAAWFEAQRVAELEAAV